MNTEIIEGNKLIANFLGKAVDGNRELNYPHWDVMQYHTSFDWLMSVVEKIENIKGEDNCYLFSVDTGRDFCIIRHNSLIQEIIVVKSVLNDKIKSTWLSVVEFIKWYNTQKK